MANGDFFGEATQTLLQGYLRNRQLDLQEQRLNVARQSAEEDRLYRKGIEERALKNQQIQEFNQVYSGATEDVKRLLKKLGNLYQLLLHEHTK